MGAHRKATDPVWRQAVRAEASICTGQASCTILWDLVKCYETVHFKHLWQEGTTLDFPLRVLRLNLRAYQMPRFVSRDGRLRFAGWLQQGVIA